MKVADAHESYGDGDDTIAEVSGHGGRIRDTKGRDVLNASR